MIKGLIVEDDKHLNQTVCIYLNQNGYEMTGCLNAEDAYDALYLQHFDFIISDIMMPGTDGYAFAREVRALNKDIPMLLMSVREDVASKRRGYALGIDDYMVKPIELEELLLRIEALLRRAKITSSQKLTIGSTVLDAGEHAVYVNDEQISLTVREFDILFKLLSYPKKTFTRTALMDAFWDAESNSGSRVVDVYMAKLRDKFKSNQDFEIKTVHGLGYKAVIK